MSRAKLNLIVLFSITVGFWATSVLFSKIENASLAKIDFSAAVASVKKNPQYFNVNKNKESGLNISALAYLVGDLGTGEIILSKNKDAIYPIASVSKLMTALVAKENIKEDEVAKVSRTALLALGGNGGLRLGEKIKVTDLLYPLLLESSNDAAEVIAEHGGREKFLEKMNARAKELAMENTRFEDPSGLSPNNQSTVYDMFKLAGHLNTQKPHILGITKTRNYSAPRHNWSNIGQFVNRPEYVGGKSGYTERAKQTVVSIFSLPLGNNASRTVAITLLQSKDRRKDVETILRYLNNNVYYGYKSDINRVAIKNRINKTEKEQDFIDLIFTGDIMLDRGVKISVVKNLKGNYNALFEKVGVLKKGDITFGNLEGTASDRGIELGNLYSFRMDPSILPALKGSGFSMLSISNNHVGDWGIPAFIDTLNRLKENEIPYTGGGMDKYEAETPTIVEKYGMTIGFLGFSDVGPEYMEARDDRAGILLANDPRYKEIIKNASNLVDYLVVSIHFGDEYKTIHNQRQELLAHNAIDSGAKIVVGHHPHVIQDTEVYTPKSCTQSSCVGYIMYSLGNFIFDQKWSEPTMIGMLAQVKLHKDGSMSVIKNTTTLNSLFQIEKVVPSKEEKINFTSQ